MKSKFVPRCMFLFLLGVGATALPNPTFAQVSDTVLFPFAPDYEGWILQYVERHYEQSGTDEVRDYAPFAPEAWADDTRYPLAPGTDAGGDGQGSFEVGLRMEGVWDASDPAHRWTERIYVQSEDEYTHNQSGWPAGFEQHPDYDGTWAYGHYGSIGAVSGDAVRLSVYQPGFAHDQDPVAAWVYTTSGVGEIWADSGPFLLLRGWNRLAIDVGTIADPSDLLTIGVRLESTHHIWGSLFVDAVTLGQVTMDGQRYVYLNPDVAWFSQMAEYDSATVIIHYDDGGALTPGVRGFHLVLHAPADCVEITDIQPGTLLAGVPNHFETLVDNGTGEIFIDWVILGTTTGATGFGSLAEITLTSVDPISDCCEPLLFDEVNSKLRDPDNNPLAAVFVGSTLSHDIGAPDGPVLSSTTHPEGIPASASDLKVTWPTTGDTGTCPAGMRGYYLLVDDDPDGAPDPRNGIYSWHTPWSPDSTSYTHWFEDLADGTWYVHIVACDWVWNGSPVDTYGPVLIDTLAPENVSDLDADITDDADRSVDLFWINPTSDFAGVKVFRKGFGNYPEYDDPPDAGEIPAWPVDPTDALANGWTLVYDGTGSSLVDLPDERDYYYYAAFAYDDAQNYAAAESGAQDESLCYWLGDFGEDGLVAIDDVLVLSLCYNTAEGNPAYNSFCDIGPTVDYGRKRRPTTDNLIEFEDLIVLAMNYENTRLPAGLAVQPCTGAMHADVRLIREDDEIAAHVLLKHNPGCLLGASVALAYGTGLAYLGAVAGDVWNAVPSYFIDSEDARRIVWLDAVALGTSVGLDGVHATARFRILTPGAEATVSLESFRARGPGNIDLTLTRVPETALEATSNVTPTMLAAAPNPTTRGTTIHYALEAEGGVCLGIFDATGRLVRQLLEASQTKGTHRVSWDGRGADGYAVRPGIYFYRLQCGGATYTRKLSVVR